MKTAILVLRSGATLAAAILLICSSGCQQTGAQSGRGDSANVAKSTQPRQNGVNLPSGSNYTASDEELAEQVRKMLTATGAQKKTTVEVKNSTVLLTADVASLAERGRIIEAAESVRGIRAVVPDIRVIPEERTDEDLASDVRSALKAEPALAPFDLTVAVRGGRVSLGGTVATWPQKRLAIWLAENVRGAREVLNAIEFAHQGRSDGVVKEAIDERLGLASGSPGGIRVEVRDGRVVLKGTVRSLLEKSRVVEDSFVEGVRTVDASGLSIDAAEAQEGAVGAAVPDEQIRRTILAALVYDPRVSSSKPRIVVQDGIVTIDGEVPTLKARTMTELLAMRAPGVREVQNKLTIANARPLTDAEVTRELQAAFLRSPDVDLYQLKIDVEDGRAVLDGTVNVTREKWSADDIAQRTPGVKAVENRIRVTESPEPVVAKYAYFHPWSYLDMPWAIPDAVTKTDDQLRKDVEQQLYWSPFTPAERIDVEVANGRVVLTGSVRNRSELQAATDNAYQAGAKRVENRLSIVGERSGLASGD